MVTRIVDALKMLGVWLLILIAVFAVLEGCFRIFRQDSNPLAEIAQHQRKTRFIPGTVFHSRSSIPGEFEFEAHINRYGYRGRDLVMPKPAGVLRIFAVGDSFTFGVGASDDETIPALLEKGLTSAGHPVEVVNAGIGGSSPVSQFLNIRDIDLKYQPDLVVFFFDMTDLWDDWQSERIAIFGKDGEIDHFDPRFINGRLDWWRAATYYSAACRYFNNKVVRSIQKMHALGMGRYMQTVKEGKRAKAVIASSCDAGSLKAAIEHDGLLLMRGREREALIREHWGRTGKYLLKIRDLLKSRGVPMVIVMYPHGIYVGADQWVEGRKTWGFEPKQYTDRLPFELMADFTRREGIPFINTLEAFLAAPKARYFFDWDGHMTPAGNHIVAGTVAADPVWADLLKKK